MELIIILLFGITETLTGITLASIGTFASRKREWGKTLIYAGLLLIIMTTFLIIIFQAHTY